MNNINKIAIFGLARSGKSALRLALHQGLEVYLVNQGEVDSWYAQVETLLPKSHCLSEDEASLPFSQMDLVILSPGIPRQHRSLKLALEKNVSVISEIEFAYQYFKNIPVIAITGTNGKTTTTTMITQSLEALGKKVFCGGNIGIPYSDLLLEEDEVDYAVIEVSSFQLESIIEFHPQVALILNVSPNHSERYEKVSQYAEAKNQIFKNMTETDVLILGRENDFLNTVKTASQKIFFSIHELQQFSSQFDTQKAYLKGEHNTANFLACKLTLDALGLGDDSSFQNFMEEFRGVEHRLEFVQDFDGLRIFNDAKSTNALATTTAIKAFSEGIYLILGGKLRNETDLLLPQLLPFKQKIKKIFLIGEVTERLAQELGSDFVIEACFDIKSVLESVKKSDLKGDLVFSPGYPSFDQFNSYIHRGECFKREVDLLFK